MSALQPLKPYLPALFGRQWDFKVGRNIDYTPRGGEPITFWLLRRVARESEIIRLAIETRKDQLCAQHWQIKGKEDRDVAEDDPRIATLTKFFRKPDTVHNWSEWYRMLLEEVFVIDATTIWREKLRGGKLNALRLIDGSTIFPLVDDLGYRPQSPDPAYQQILKGVPKANYTTDELIYAPRNVRVYTPYGYGAVEQCLMSCRTDIEREKNQLAYFTAGSVPDAYMTMADGMPNDAIKSFEDRFNDLLAGNITGKRKVPFVPFGSKLEQTKPPALKDEFDEWLARKICFALSIPPTPFIKQMNRATAETAHDSALEEGQGPMMDWTEHMLTDIIETDFGYDDLEFSFVDEKEQDPAVASTILVNETSNSIITINEAREAKGLDPSPEPAADELLMKTATGWVPLPGSALAEQLNQDKLDAAIQTAAAAPAPVAGAPGKPGSATNGGKPAPKPAAAATKKPAAAAAGAKKPVGKAAGSHTPLTFRYAVDHSHARKTDE